MSGDYIDVEKTLLVPLKPVSIKFYEKEEVALNAFQNFILESIENKANLEQMINATMLTRNVVETEILQMESQKLLVRNEKGIELSELSKNILLVSRCVKSLNNEEKIMCVNMITGNIEGYNDDEYCDLEGNDLVMSPQISSNDIAGISIENNMSFLIKYMSTFDNLTEKQIDIIIASIYAEVNDTKKKIVYKKSNICKLPCLIGNDSMIDEAKEDILYAEGSCSVVTLAVSTENVERYREYISDIEKVYRVVPELISDIGKILLNEYAICKGCNENNNTFLYDHVSGKILMRKYKASDNNNKRIQLKLNPVYKFDNETQNQIINKAITNWHLDECYQVKIIDIQEQKYRVGFLLTKLWGEDHENE